MKKSDLKLLNDTLNKALDPPRRKPISKSALDDLLEPYEDGNQNPSRETYPPTDSHEVAGYSTATSKSDAPIDAPKLIIVHATGSHNIASYETPTSQESAGHEIASYQVPTHNANTQNTPSHEIASYQIPTHNANTQNTPSHEIASYNSQLPDNYQANEQPPSSQLRSNQLPDSQLPNRIILNWRSIEHSRIPNKVYDEILPTLPPMTHSPYLHLLRLTLGFSRKRCRITQETLAKRCNQSLAGIKKQLSYLISCRLLRSVTVTYGGNNRGVEYEPVIPGIFNDNESSQLPNSQLPNSQLPNSQPQRSRMKVDHDDHDSLKENHHRVSRTATTSAFEEMMMTKYQELTGNIWTQADHSVFAEIEMDIEDIPQNDLYDLLETIAARATSPIGSFKFFSIALKNELAEKPILSHKVLRERYESCVRELHKKFVGKQWESPSEKCFEFKRIVIKQLLPWNDDLANEVLMV